MSSAPTSTSNKIKNLVRLVELTALQTSDEGAKVLWCAKVILKALCTRKQQLILTKSESYILFCCVFRFCEERVRESKRVLKTMPTGFLLIYIIHVFRNYFRQNNNSCCFLFFQYLSLYLYISFIIFSNYYYS